MNPTTHSDRPPCGQGPKGPFNQHAILMNLPSHFIYTDLEAVVLVLREQHVLPVLLHHRDELVEGAVDAFIIVEVEVNRRSFIHTHAHVEPRDMISQQHDACARTGLAVEEGLLHDLAVVLRLVLHAPVVAAHARR